MVAKSGTSWALDRPPPKTMNISDAPEDATDSKHPGSQVVSSGTRSLGHHRRMLRGGRLPALTEQHPGENRRSRDPRIKRLHVSIQMTRRWTHRPDQQAGACDMTTQDTTPEDPPSLLRIAVSAIIVLAGTVLGLHGLLTHVWVQALGGGLIAIGQLPFLLVLLRQRQDFTHKPVPAETRRGDEG